MSNLIISLVILLLPLFGPGTTPAVLAVAAAHTLYRGSSAAVVYSMFGALLAVELFYGFDPGTLSLAYLAGAFLFVGIQRFVAIPAWATLDGWHGSDAVRAFVGAWALFLVTTGVGLVVGQVIYGYGQLGHRLIGLFTVSGSRVGPAVIAVVLVTLRRVDEPFHRPLIFGI